MNNTLIKYSKPANSWEECLPIGNGFIGGMISGNVKCDEIYLNEDSYWYGGYRNRNNPDTVKNIDKIRNLIFDGKIAEAEKLGMMSMVALPESARHYLPAGLLNIHFEIPDVYSYSRELSLSDALVTTSFEADGVEYKREYFASNPDNLIVVKLSANQENALSFSVSYAVDRYLEKLYCIGDDSIIRTAYSGGKDGIDLVNLLKVECDGVVQGIGKTVMVEDATEAIIYISCATSFRHDDPTEYCQNTIVKAQQKGYAELLREHINDYKQLFERMELKLDSTSAHTTTDKLLYNINDTQSFNQLIETYFNFGRYLLISSSRAGSLPANLQGIWNKEYLPKWDSKYTININTEMNYWPAELLNLSDCHQPLFDLLERMVVNGEVTAKEMYNCCGFMAHHNTDIWADTAPQDRWLGSTIWCLGGAWLSLHIIDRYNFTCDIDFIKKYYHILKKACEFILDYQIEYNGKLVICPSLSPENSYRMKDGKIGTLTYQPAMDGQIIHTLFTAVIKITGILNIDVDFASKLENAVKKMPSPVALTADGRIMEWIEDYDEPEPGHRHISHLFALFPSNMIGDNDELLTAAEKTLRTRLEHGGGHTGWSMAWIINLWARLKKSDELYLSLKDLLGNSTLPNLMDNHPPFQIDGNFGSIAGIGEALLQSHNGYIEILPCLPKQWNSGSVRGLCARGNIEVDIKWRNGTVTTLVLRSKNHRQATVIVKIGAETKNVTIEANEEKTVI